MKKIAIIILSSFVAASVFSFSLAFAADGLVKVYYNEDIGTGGTRVYHVTYCQKAPSYGPVRCLLDPNDNTKVMFESQTAEQCKAKDGAVLDMAYVRGCYGNPKYINMGSTADAIKDYVKFPNVDITKLKQKSTEGDRKGCADQPENQAALYGPEWAVVTSPPPETVPLQSSSSSPPEQQVTNLLGTVVWPAGNSADPPAELTAYVSKKYSSGDTSGQVVIVKPMYRAVLCDEYDVPVGTPPDGWQEINRSGMSEAARGREPTNPHPTVDSQCNTNNSGKPVEPSLNGPGGKPVGAASIINTENTYSCTIKYLITGKSGSDVLATYIGALYKWAAGLVGIISVLIIVFSGIQISAAGGDSAKLDTAKNRIAQSIIGLVILFLAGLILYTINPTFFVG
jgi:hypothetical protein